MGARAFDVVLVPDFSGPTARRFEIMTLLFLASWLEFGGKSRDLPLHLACVGEAPKSVRSLGRRCGAEITSHQPLLSGGFINKLLGYNVKGHTDHVLLLDSDMLILSEFQTLPGMIGQDCIAAAASNGATMLRREKWQNIYDLLGMQFPENEVVPLNRELDTLHCVPYRDKEHFFPYYNGGVVYAPWRCNLGAIWQDHLVRIAEFEPNIRGPKGFISNQPSLATAIAYLQSQGFEFRLLPDEFHVRWQHISSGAVSLKDTRLLHTIGFGRWKWGKMPDSAEGDIEAYLYNTRRLTKKLRSHRDPLTRLSHLLTRREQIRDCTRVYRVMRRLYDNYVRELIG